MCLVGVQLADQSELSVLKVISIPFEVNREVLVVLRNNGYESYAHSEDVVLLLRRVARRHRHQGELRAFQSKF